MIKSLDDVMQSVTVGGKLGFHNRRVWSISCVA